MKKFVFLLLVFISFFLVSCVTYNTVKLSYNTNKTSRPLFSDSLTWNSIAVYTGYCVATTAGFCLMSYGGIWLKVAGAIAATAGTLSMSNQLIKWSQCSELFSFISALKSNNGTSLTSIADSQNGSKIITVVTESAITVGVCYCTSTGKALVKSVVSSINSIIDKIIAVFPKGVTISINGVTLKRIGI